MCSTTSRASPPWRRRKLRQSRYRRPAALIERTSRDGRRKTHEDHTMALTFPNRMRFYDTARCAVRFWGHDGALESSFFVAADSLKQLQPAMRFNENSILAAFDLNREVIQSAAAKAYARTRKSSYELVAADF